MMARAGPGLRLGVVSRRPGGGRVRQLRSDVARNRRLLVEAAMESFQELGWDVPLDTVARRAGVGNATVFRRFPTKDALIRAIFEDLLDEIDELVAEAEAVDDPWQSFARYVAATAELQISNQGFFDVVNQRLGAVVLSPEQRGRALAGTARLLKRAQDAGVVRSDIVPEDVQIMLRMVGAATRPAIDGTPMDERWPRYLGLLLDGLRPSAATPLPVDTWAATNGP
jgi:AcrR family transcriptional regulator